MLLCPNWLQRRRIETPSFITLGWFVVALSALVHAKPNSIDDYSILVGIRNIYTKHVHGSESVLRRLPLLWLSGRGAFIRIDNLAHLLLVLALASMLITRTPLPWARAVGLSELLALAAGAV